MGTGIFLFPDVPLDVHINAQCGAELNKSLLNESRNQ